MLGQKNMAQMPMQRTVSPLPMPAAQPMPLVKPPPAQFMNPAPQTMPPMQQGMMPPPMITQGMGPQGIQGLASMPQGMMPQGMMPVPFQQPNIRTMDQMPNVMNRADFSRLLANIGRFPIQNMQFGMNRMGGFRPQMQQFMPGLLG